jgi:CO/xanthine dehydrogenase FAD-binding subunit
MQTEMYFRPRTVDEALSLLVERRPQPLAGGTDVYPALASGAAPVPLLDLGGIEGFAGPVVEDADGFVIPPLATWTTVIETPLPPQFDVLRQAGREVGGRQIQNRGTVVGNVCNASPAADGTVALMALDARVRLRGPDGSREVPLVDFVVGNRRTLRRPDELVVALVVPRRDGARSAFRKLGARRYLVISIAMTAVVVTEHDGLVASAAVAVGSCNARAVRLASIERWLIGRPLAEAAAELVDGPPLPELAPITDIRAEAAYRARAARLLIADALAACGTGRG